MDEQTQADARAAAQARAQAAREGRSTEPTSARAGVQVTRKGGAR